MATKFSFNIYSGQDKPYIYTHAYTYMHLYIHEWELWKCFIPIYISVLFYKRLHRNVVMSCMSLDLYSYYPWILNEDCKFSDNSFSLLFILHIHLYTYNHVTDSHLLLHCVYNYAYICIIYIYPLLTISSSREVK